MKYSLRSLMVVAILLPPVLAGCYFVCRNNTFAWLLLVLLVGLIVISIRSGGLPGSSRFPPP